MQFLAFLCPKLKAVDRLYLLPQSNVFFVDPVRSEFWKTSLNKRGSQAPLLKKIFSLFPDNKGLKMGSVRTQPCLSSSEVMWTLLKVQNHYILLDILLKERRRKKKDTYFPDKGTWLFQSPNCLCLIVWFLRLADSKIYLHIQFQISTESLKTQYFSNSYSIYCVSNRYTNKQTRPLHMCVCVIYITS